MIENTNQPLNRILYGPPGTGKTYNAITHALSIIENKDIEELEKQDRKELKKRFDELLIDVLNESSGNIAFCTFHQSMSYEDFVEGIKPIEPNGDNSLEYDIEDGIFKRLCLKAALSGHSNFEEAYEKLLNELDNGSIKLLRTATGKEFGIKVNSKNNLTLYTGGNFKKSKGTLTKERFIELYAGSWPGYRDAVLLYLKEKYSYNNDSVATNDKPFVLIIDEINRGNISQIFGELITLIEKDKRAGADESLSVTLPYSKESFSVPSNLYIIGTMNTADRSVEALDTALRRRFDFIEMAPKPEKLDGSEIDGINLRKLLETINGRIELLLDTDHLIGHSYFMNMDGAAGLQNAFQNKIIPLLQEYFYGDYGKIGLVIGEKFFDDKKRKFEFSKFPYDGKDELKDRTIYHLKNISSMKPAEFSEAVKEIFQEA